MLHHVLAGLGVRERCDFVRVDPGYRVEWPGLALEAPSELERFVEAHVEQFPHAAKGIRGFVEDCLTIRTETSRAEEGAGPNVRPERFPLLLRYRRATLARCSRTASTIRPRAPRSRRSGPTSGCRRRASPSSTSRRC